MEKVLKRMPSLYLNQSREVDIDFVKRLLDSMEIYSKIFVIEQKDKITLAQGADYRSDGIVVQTILNEIDCNSDLYIRTYNVGDKEGFEKKIVYNFDMILLQNLLTHSIGDDSPFWNYENILEDIYCRRGFPLLQYYTFYFGDNVYPPLKTRLKKNFNLIY